MKLWMLGVFPGVLPMTSSASKERLLSGPGGRPEADGQKVLDPEVLRLRGANVCVKGIHESWLKAEVFVQTIRFKVADGREQDFEKYWSEHGEALKAAKHGEEVLIPVVCCTGWPTLTCMRLKVAFASHSFSDEIKCQMMIAIT